jgi:serine/threonine protein kinase
VIHTPLTAAPLVKTEVDAIKKLCGPDIHENIVEVLNHGHLAKAPYYFIDMELCDLNLHDYIHRETPPEPSEAIPYFVRGQSWLLVVQISNVMRQIAAAVEYIHRKGHIHRDIKPRNGGFFPVLE